MEPARGTGLMSSVRKLYSLLTASERRTAFGLLGLMSVAAVLEAFSVGLVVPALTILVQTDPVAQYPWLGRMMDAAGGATQERIVTVGIVLFAAAYLVKAAFITFVIWRQNTFTFGLQARLAQLLFKVYLRQPYTFHLQRNSAQLLRNAVTEVLELMYGGIMPAMMLISESLVLIGIGLLLVYFQPVGAFIVGIALGAAAWLFRVVTAGPVGAWGKVRADHEGARIQLLQEGLGSAKEVKLLGREDDFLKQHARHSLASARAGRLFYTLLELPRLGLELLSVIGLAALVLTLLARGRDMTNLLLTLGLFAAAAFRLMPSMNRLVFAAQRIRSIGSVIDTLYGELTLPAPEPAAVAPGSTNFTTAIRVNNVGYSYPAGPRPALEGVSLIIHKNESVGFVGPSGSGKSTLVDVILGLLTPEVGTVLVDEWDIQEHMRRWQNQIGYVPQSIYLTDDSLRRNVAFGLADEDIDEAAVQRAITAAQMDEFVASLPDGLDTPVGERGVRMSGGERQRIGIARALYHDPAVLVLDEATSSLDVATERRVMQAVMALRRTKTVLIIAHRLTTVEHCDRIYRLEHGRVTTEGASAHVLRGEAAAP